MTGQIQGGWEFIWAAYGVVWVGIVGYAVSLLRRRAAVSNAMIDEGGNEP